MAQMDGCVGFDSEPPNGATFWLSLPIEAQAEVQAEATAQVQTPSVLVVDDDPMIADFIALVLRKAGYLPTTSVTLKGAQQQLQETHYDAMVTDLRLQDGHGLNLIREVRAQAALAHMPILVVSAYCDEGQRLTHGQVDEFLAWLDKPVDEKKLLSMLDAVMNRARAK